MKSLKKVIEVKRTSKGIRVMREVQPKLSSRLAWPPGAVHTKMDAQDVYGDFVLNVLPMRGNFRR
jgi:hypothetical protein